MKRKRLDQVFNDHLTPSAFIVQGYVFYMRNALYRVNHVYGGELQIINVVTGKKSEYDIDFIYENGYQSTYLESKLYGLS